MDQSLIRKRGQTDGALAVQGTRTGTIALVLKARRSLRTQKEGTLICN
jgi:hypothetical protein